MRRAATADFSSSGLPILRTVFLSGPRHEAPHAEPSRTVRIQQLQRAHTGFANQSGNTRQRQFQFSGSGDGGKISRLGPIAAAPVRAR